MRPVLFDFGHVSFANGQMDQARCGAQVPVVSPAAQAEPWGLISTGSSVATTSRAEMIAHRALPASVLKFVMFVTPMMKDPGDGNFSMERASRGKAILYRLLGAVRWLAAPPGNVRERTCFANGRPKADADGTEIV
jgi:hypothetical protein